MQKPKCENCGQFVYPVTSTFHYRRITHLKPPKHCPNCGTKLSHIKRRQVDKYTDYSCIYKCIIGIGLIIVMIILINYRVL
jgi:hypothetical protein